MGKSWFVITIYITKNYSDAISNFLIEQGARGIEEFEEFPERLKLRGYFIEDSRKKKILNSIHRYLNSLKSMDPEMFPAKIDTLSIPDKDWSENWKRFFKPIKVSKRFLIKPPWVKVGRKRGQVPITILPAMAFGTGTHPTTKMCIKALEAIIQKKGLSVLDLGTGSGILSIVSAKLGARVVWAIDIDETALENAKENVEKNGLSDVIKIKKGSIGSVRRGFDIVVANISLRSLKRMSFAIKKRVYPKGFLILSGLLKNEKKELERYYVEGKKFKLIKTLKDGEWICLILKKIC
jgi:ribosomal protein L11 methyltransferase